MAAPVVMVPPAVPEGRGALALYRVLMVKVVTVAPLGVVVTVVPEDREALALDWVSMVLTAVAVVTVDSPVLAVPEQVPPHRVLQGLLATAATAVMAGLGELVPVVCLLPAETGVLVV